MTAPHVRRSARERALQLLFYLEMNPSEQVETAVRQFWEQQATLGPGDRLGSPVAPVSGHDPALQTPEGERLRAFATRLTEGVLRHREALDARLAGYLRNWSLERLGGVERNVLRLALYELFYEQDVPPVVCINEAVDLAKYFSATGAGRFVNGILDRARKEVSRDPRLNPPWRGTGVSRP